MNPRPLVLDLGGFPRNDIKYIHDRPYPHYHATPAPATIPTTVTTTPTASATGGAPCAPLVAEDTREAPELAAAAMEVLIVPEAVYGGRVAVDLISPLHWEEDVSEIRGARSVSMLTMRQSRALGQM